MYLSTTSESRLEMSPVADINKAEAWDLASIGLAMLNSNLQVKFCNPYLQALLSGDEQTLTDKNFLQFLDIDNHLRAHITSELAVRHFWQGIIHNANHALRIEIKRSE